MRDSSLWQNHAYTPPFQPDCSLVTLLEGEDRKFRNAKAQGICLICFGRGCECICHKEPA